MGTQFRRPLDEIERRLHEQLEAGETLLQNKQVYQD
jgi:hypothetical protein